MIFMNSKFFEEYVSDDVELYYNKLMNKFNNEEYYGSRFYLSLKVDKHRNEWRNKYIASEVAKKFTNNFGDKYDCRMKMEEVTSGGLEMAFIVVTRKKVKHNLIKRFYEWFRK